MNRKIWLHQAEQRFLSLIIDQPVTAESAATISEHPTRCVSPAWAPSAHLASADASGALPASEVAQAVQTAIMAATRNAKPER